MKTTIYLAMAFALLSQTTIAQSTTVNFGRHGSCSAGRGICNIQQSPERDTGNASLVRDKGILILQIHTQRLSEDEKRILTESIINSPAGYLTIEEGFELSDEVLEKMRVLGSNLTHFSSGNYPISQQEGRVDIHLIKHRP